MEADTESIWEETEQGLFRKESSMKANIELGFEKLRSVETMLRVANSTVAQAQAELDLAVSNFEGGPIENIQKAKEFKNLSLQIEGDITRLQRDCLHYLVTNNPLKPTPPNEAG